MSLLNVSRLGDLPHALAPVESQRNIERLAWQPERADAIAFGDAQEDTQHGGMHMDVQMSVDVRQRHAGAQILLELRTDLAFQLCLDARREEVAEADGDRVGTKHPRGVDQFGDAARRRGCVPLHQHEMQADGQRRRRAR